MDNKVKLLRRLVSLFGIMIGLICITVAGLFSLQVINGKEYREQAQNRLTTSSSVSASRGEIVDRYGRPLVTNQSVYSLRIDYPYWNKQNQNYVILELVQLIRNNGSFQIDSLPISEQLPFEYIGEPQSKERKALEAFADNVKIDKNISAEQMVEKLREYYDIDPELSPANIRIIAGIRYEMQQSNFSAYNSFIIASDVSMDLIAKVKEQHKKFAGVNVETEALRKYETTYAAHVLGRISKIHKEDWDYYKEKGYSMNAMVGVEGVEKSFEQYLKGTDGTKAIEKDATGKVTNIVESTAPKPGNNCILTLDLDVQKAAEDSLARHLSNIEGAGGGAAVAIAVNSGQVLALASYPTYDLTRFNELYSLWAADKEKNPLYNRAIQGAYQPGSTLKPLTAIAGLEEGVIKGKTLIDCQHYYTQFESHTFKCLGRHGPTEILRALQKSCNIYFYETSYRLGGKKLEEWLRRFGFGEKTGIELEYERAGTASGPENRKRMLERSPLLNQWQPGDVVTTGIGQCDNLMTPIQLANYTAAIANGGTLYKPSLLRSIKTYDYTGTVIEEKSEVIRQIEISKETLKLVHKGMAEVTDERGTAAKTFKNYPIKVAGKSGTAQHGERDKNGKVKNDHAVFIAFAPYDNPQIAVAVVGEYAKSGSDVAPIVRDIFDAYFTDGGSVNNIIGENTLIK